jgi:predicted deacylase
VVVVPLFNVASFRQLVAHQNPVDSKGMNRMYPGKPDGTQTERASWAVTKEVIEKCDYLIDYHGGDLDENLRRYSYWADTGNAAMDAVSRRMVLAFGLDHIIIQKNPGATLTPGATTITRMAQNLGKPAIAVEAGHAGTTEPGDIEALVEGTLSTMRELKMLPGDPSRVANPIWLSNAVAVASEHEGVFRRLVEPEAYVQKGTRLGTVTDYFGAKLGDVLSPLSGIIIYVRAVPSLRKGDNVAYIGEVSGPAGAR